VKSSGGGRLSWSREEAQHWLCCWCSAFDISFGQPHHEETDDAYLTGRLHPISARVTDTVQQVLIDDNQHVVEGQTLVILDPNDYNVRLDQAKAALDAAGREADTAEAAIRSTSQYATAQTTQAVGTIGEAKASILGVEGRRHRC
jgi:multidrug resistance efflux pump